MRAGNYQMAPAGENAARDLHQEQGLAQTKAEAQG
jgi:hypothetical protein